MELVRHIWLVRVEQAETGNFIAIISVLRLKKKKKGEECKSKHKIIKKPVIEDLVIKSVMEIIMDDAILEYMADEAVRLMAQESAELPLLRKQLANVKKGIKNIVNAIQAMGYMIEKFGFIVAMLASTACLLISSAFISIATRKGISRATS